MDKDRSATRFTLCACDLRLTQDVTFACSTTLLWPGNAPIGQLQAFQRGQDPGRKASYSKHWIFRQRAAQRAVILTCIAKG